MKNHFLIWDFDGTLGYREGRFSGTLLEVWQSEYGNDGTVIDQFTPHLQTGFPWHHPEIVRAPLEQADVWWEKLYPIFERAFRDGCGATASIARSLAQDARPVFLDLQRWHLLDSAIDVLQQLSEIGWNHILLSNHVPELQQILQHLNIRHFFSHIFNSAETGVEKPHPKAFENVLEKLPTERRVIMIGDSVRADIHGAKAVGIESILVHQHHPDAPLSCPNLHSLINWLHIP